MEQRRRSPSDAREIRGWMVCDWGFHGFITTVATALAPVYITALAQMGVGSNGTVFDLGWLGKVTAKSFFPTCVSASVLLQVLFLPILGALADYTSGKKRLVGLLSGVGASATGLLFLAGAGIDFRWGGALFILANLAYGATKVPYNSLLPEIATPGESDRVSSRGYAMGYLGGGLLLAANLALVTSAGRLGLSSGMASRLCLLSGGLWWGGFCALGLRFVRRRPPTRPMPPGSSPWSLGVAGMRATWDALRALPHTRRYLVAYLLFSDGIQTVVAVASVFLAQELFVARGLEADYRFLLGLILMVQFVAFVGALAFERIAAWLGTKRALVLCLVLWCGVVVYGYGFLQTTRQAWVMGAAIATVLGGSQALSRSLFSRMIPKGHEASFFGIYEIAQSGTSWIGPLLFGIVVASTGSYRDALLSLIVLLGTGTVLLCWNDTDRAILDAGRAPGSVAEAAPLSPREAWVPRRLVDGALSGFLRLALGVFFREIQVVGRSRIPKDGPLILVANHTNSVVDAMLVLGFLSRRPRMLAKAPLFVHPFMGPLVRLAGALPVYRPGDPSASTAKNRGTFSRCVDELASGGAIALFPEGTSHNEPHALPLKTGAARIALEAEGRRGPMGVRIVPLGLHFEDKERFRSRVLLVVGEPLAASAPGGATDRQAVKVLTGRIARGLEAVTFNCSTWEEAQLVTRAADLLGGAPRSGDLLFRFRLAQALLRGYQEMKELMPERVAEIVAALAELDREVRAEEAAEGRARPDGLLPRAVAALGGLLNAVPWRVTGWLTARLSETPDATATYTILAALLLFPLTWAGAAAAVGFLSGSVGAAMFALVSAVAVGVSALRLHGEGAAPSKPPGQPWDHNPPGREALRQEILCLVEAYRRALRGAR